MKNSILTEFGGFTLIELLVVVLIIGILSAVALPQYTKAVAKARLSNMQVLVKSLKDAQEVHYMEHGVYATDFDSFDIDVPPYQTLSDLDLTCSAKTANYKKFSICPLTRRSFVAGKMRLSDNSLISFSMRLNQSPDTSTFFKHPIVCGGGSSPTNNLAQQLCKSMGGKNPYDDGSMTYYQIQ